MDCDLWLLFFFILKIYLFIWENVCVCQKEGAEGEGESLMRAQLSVGFDPRTVRSWPEPKSKGRYLTSCTTQAPLIASLLNCGWVEGQFQTLKSNIINQGVLFELSWKTSRHSSHLCCGAAFQGLLCKWAPWPSILVPATHDHVPKAIRGYCQGFHQPTGDSMAAISSSSSLVAAYSYYQYILCSTSGNSSCTSAPIPHHPGLPKADLGHWWARFFFGMSDFPFIATVLESPECSESPQASSSTITCDLALEAMRKQPGDHPGKANTRPQSWVATTSHQAHSGSTRRMRALLPSR